MIYDNDLLLPIPIDCKSEKLLCMQSYCQYIITISRYGGISMHSLICVDTTISHCLMYHIDTFLQPYII